MKDVVLQERRVTEDGFIAMSSPNGCRQQTMEEKKEYTTCVKSQHFQELNNKSWLQRHRLVVKQMLDYGKVGR